MIPRVRSAGNETSTLYVCFINSSGSRAPFGSGGNDIIGVCPVEGLLRKDKYD